VVVYHTLQECSTDVPSAYHVSHVFVASGEICGAIPQGGGEIHNLNWWIDKSSLDDCTVSLFHIFFSSLSRAEPSLFYFILLYFIKKI
jgi:hypothetical protein